MRFIRPLAILAAAVAVVGMLPGLPASAQPTSAAASATYYVDSSIGNDNNTGTSPNAPWRTLDKINSTHFSPGDHVLLHGGSTWNGELQISSSGTPAAPIVVGGYGEGRPQINGQGLVTDAVSVQNASNVTIQGLEVTNSADMTVPNTSIHRGIYVEAKDIGEVNGITIRDNDVHNVEGPAKSGGIGAGGIAIGVRGNSTPTWFNNLHITGNEVSDINAYGISTFTTWCANCEIYPAETGIPTSEVSAQRQPYTGLVIDQNYVHDVTGGGITPQYADGAVVEYNTVDRAASHQLVAGGGNVGIWWQGTDGIVVQYNTVRHTAAEGIYSNADGMAFDADMGTTHSTVQYNISDSNNGGFYMCLISAYNNQVRYNLSVNDKRLDFRLLSGCGNTRIYNNTIWGSLQKTPTLIAPGVPGTPAAMEGITVAQSASHAIVDNIFYNPTDAAYRVAGQPANAYSHNVYWDGTASGTAKAPNDPAATIGDPQLANPTATLPSSGFITPAEFRAYFAAFTPAASSPARNIGVTEWGQQADALGTTIPLGAVDAGAIQHAVKTTATTTMGNSQNLTHLTDQNGSTSWSSATHSPADSGTLELTFSEPRKLDAVTFALSAGKSHGPNTVTIQSWNGSSWVTEADHRPLNWYSDVAGTQYAKVPLDQTTSTSRLRFLMSAANLNGNHLQISEISASYLGVAASAMGEASPTNTVSNVVDHDPTTSWASDGGNPGYIEVDSTPITATSITISTAFGQGQGPTSVFVQAINGDNGAWQQVAPLTPITWSSNTGTVESRTITFTHPVTATKFEVQIRGANLTWGHVAINDLTIQ